MILEEQLSDTSTISPKIVFYKNSIKNYVNSLKNKPNRKSQIVNKKTDKSVLKTSMLVVGLKYLSILKQCLSV